MVDATAGSEAATDEDLRVADALTLCLFGFLDLLVDAGEAGIELLALLLLFGEVVVDHLLADLLELKGVHGPPHINC